MSFVFIGIIKQTFSRIFIACIVNLTSLQQSASNISNEPSNYKADQCPMIGQLQTNNISQFNSAKNDFTKLLPTCSAAASGFLFLVMMMLYTANTKIGETQNSDRHHPRASAHIGNSVLSYLVGEKSINVNIKMD